MTTSLSSRADSAAVRPASFVQDAAPGSVVEDLRRRLLTESLLRRPVTRSEAESLFDIDPGMAGPDFADFFALAIGNYLLSCGSSIAPEVNEALRRERWLDGRLSASQGIEGCFSRALTCVISGDGFLDSRGGWIAAAAARTVLDAKAGEGVALLDIPEAAWLKERIARSDSSNPAIAALVRFVQSGSRAADTGRRPVLDAVA